MKFSNFILFAVFFSINAYSELVLIKDERQINTIQSLKSALRNIGVEAIEPSWDPNIANIQQELFKLTQKMLTANEQGQKIYLVLGKPATANAFFYKINDQERLVYINMGLLNFLKEESEIAYVIGHELEHGWSELGQKSEAEQDSLAKSLLRRAEENEVDLKSVFKRMLPSGADPYAAERALRKFRIESGDEGFSATHSKSSSREDSVALAITAARRELGMEISINQASTLNTHSISEAQKLEQNGIYLNYLFQDIERKFSNIQEEVNELFKSRLNDKNRESYRGSGMDGFESNHWNQKVAKLLPNEISKDVYIRLKKAHILAVAKAYATAYDHQVSNQKKLSKNQIFQSSRLLEVPFPEYALEQAKKKLEDEQDYLKLREQWLLEAEEKDKKRLKKEEDKKRAEVEICILKVQIEEQIKPAWEKSAQLLRIRRASFLADRPTEAGKILKGSDLAVLGDSHRQEALWKYADAYFDKFDPYNLSGGAQEDVSEIWKTLFKVDKARALKVWEKLLLKTSAKLSESDNIYTKDWPGYVNLIQKKFKDSDIAPLLKASTQKILQPTMVDWFNRSIEKQLSAMDWKEHAQYGLKFIDAEIEEYFKIKVQIESFVQKDLVSADYLKELNLKEDKRITDYIHHNFASAPDEIKKGVQESDIHLIFDFLKKDSKNPAQTLHYLSSIKAPAMKDFLYRAFDGKGLRSFFGVLRKMNPVTEDDKKLFYETLYNLKIESFDRPIEPYLPFVDSDLSHFLGYFDWLVENHPQEDKLIKKMFELPQHQERFSYSTNLPKEEVEKIKSAHEEFFKKDKALPRHLIARKVKEYILKDIRRFYLENNNNVLDTVKFAKSNYSGHLEKYLGDFLNIFNNRPYALKELAKGSRYSDEGGTGARFLEQVEKELNHNNLSQNDLKHLAEVYLTIVKTSEIKSIWRDRLFKQIWERGDNSVREVLAIPTIVEKLLTYQEKRRVVNWKIEKEIPFEKINKAADLITLRNSVTKTRQLLEEYLPEVSDLRDTLVDEYAQKLLTNPNETDHLFELATSAENIYESKGILLVDLPHHFQNMIKEPWEKMALLELLTGEQNSESLTKKLGDRMGVSAENTKLVLEGLQVRFRESHLIVRTYVLMSLLDDHDGLLSETAMAEQIYQKILGPHYSNKNARTAFEAYIEALPKGEKRVVLSRILAGMIDSPKDSQGFVRRIVDGLKTLGYKGAQFLRAAGLVPKELEPEFEGVFDRAIRPKRNAVINHLRKAFGENLDGIEYIGELLGFGSVNFVQSVDFKNPHGKVEGAVRGMHENVVGQIRNEAEVWDKAISSLEKNADAEIRATGHYLRDALSASMETLKAGGSEVNLTKDRELIAKASPVYQRSKNRTRSGYEIKVIPVLSEFQNKIQPEMQDSTSVHPRVDHVRVDQHEQTQALSRDAMNTELISAYHLGKFDVDGHPGNWLVDKVRNVLWRTDVSQFREVPESKVHQKALQILLKPYLSEYDRRKLVELTSYLFQFENVSPQKVQATFRSLLDSYGLPESNPVRNLYFYRGKLNEELGVESKLRFKPETVWYIQTLARNNIHAEKTGTWTQYYELNKAAGNSTVPTVMNFCLKALFEVTKKK